jgi:hypothetical protein
MKADGIISYPGNPPPQKAFRPLPEKNLQLQQTFCNAF